MDIINLISIKQPTCFKAYDVSREFGVHFEDGITYQIRRADA